MEKLFTYGTLQNEDVQETIFGRTLQGTTETLIGYTLKEILIEEEFGIEPYPIIMETQNSEDSINGIMYEITTQELHKVDTYEGLHYKRVEVSLQSDEVVWAYSAKV
jgi:gamma-glutamylcyclotransferase (GGCT)/AIG2-like uncharacterized protein YtfP